MPHVTTANDKEIMRLPPPPNRASEHVRNKNAHVIPPFYMQESTKMCTTLFAERSVTNPGVR